MLMTLKGIAAMVADCSFIQVAVERLGQGCGWKRVWDKRKLTVSLQVACSTDTIRGSVLFPCCCQSHPCSDGC